MILLYEHFWPWLLLGCVFIFWGLLILNLNLRQWLKLLGSLFYESFSEDTSSQKKKLEEPIDDTLSANPGCVILMVGLVFLGYGLFRWWN